MQIPMLFLKDSDNDNDSYSSCHVLTIRIITTAVISIRLRIVMRPAMELSMQSFANPSIHTSVVTNARLLILMFLLVRMTAQTFT